MSHFTSHDLMVAVLPEAFGVELMAAPKTCTASSCTNPTGKRKPALATDADLAGLQDQLQSIAS